jgi:putative hydrolase of HD superfamily
MNSALLSLLHYANDLKQLPRTGWLLAGLPFAESIADHSFVTALLSLALAQTINEDPAAQGLSQPLDVGVVLQTALIHDLAESVVTDLPRRTTDLLGEEVKHDAERRALAKLTVGLTDGAQWMNLLDEYNDAATPEARLVRDADKLEMAHQALRYRRSGYFDAEQFAAPRQWAFPLTAALHAELWNAIRSGDGLGRQS